MKNKKKNIIITCIVLTVLIAVILLGPRLTVFGIALYKSKWAYIPDFKSYKEDYKNVVDYIQTNYSDDEKLYFSVKLDENGKRTLHASNERGDMQLPVEVSESLERIDSESFDTENAYLNLIRKDGSRISFCSSRYYELVYSPEGRPKDVHARNARRIRVRSLGNGWYHMAWE